MISVIPLLHFLKILKILIQIQIIKKTNLLKHVTQKEMADLVVETEGIHEIAK